MRWLLKTGAAMSDTDEYLRRNLNVAKACGAAAGARAILNRLAARKRTPKWLVDAVYDIYSRTKPLSRELAAYRDEVKLNAVGGGKA
jgi:hypothetical protein